MRVLLTMDVALFKPYCRRTKNKIGGSFNITMPEILPAAVIICEQHVLVANEPTIKKTGHVSIRFNSYGLPGCESCIVLKSDILCRKIICPDQKTPGCSCVDGIACGRNFSS